MYLLSRNGITKHKWKFSKQGNWEFLCNVTKHIPIKRQLNIQTHLKKRTPPASLPATFNCISVCHTFSPQVCKLTVAGRGVRVENNLPLLCLWYSDQTQKILLHLPLSSLFRLHLCYHLLHLPHFHVSEMGTKKKKKKSTGSALYAFFYMSILQEYFCVE